MRSKTVSGFFYIYKDLLFPPLAFFWSLLFALRLHATLPCVSCCMCSAHDTVPPPAGCCFVFCGHFYCVALRSFPARLKTNRPRLGSARLSPGGARRCSDWPPRRRTPAGAASAAPRSRSPPGWRSPSWTLSPPASGPAKAGARRKLLSREKSGNEKSGRGKKKTSEKMKRVARAAPWRGLKFLLSHCSSDTRSPPRQPAHRFLIPIALLCLAAFCKQRGAGVPLGPSP